MSQVYQFDHSAKEIKEQKFKNKGLQEIQAYNKSYSIKKANDQRDFVKINELALPNINNEKSKKLDFVHKKRILRDKRQFYDKRRSIEKLYFNKNNTNGNSQYGMQGLTEDILIESPSKMLNQEIIQSNTFSNGMTSKTICENYNKMYNTPSQKSSEIKEKQTPTPMSSPDSSSRILKYNKESEQMMNENIYEPNTLMPAVKLNSKNAKSNSKIHSEISKGSESFKQNSNYSSILVPNNSQQTNINKCDANVEKYKKNALSKRRQHSSYKSNAANIASKISEEFEGSPSSYICDRRWEIDTKETKSDYEEICKEKQQDEFFFNRKISEDLKRRQDNMCIEENNYPKNPKLIELAPLKEDIIASCKSEVNQKEECQNEGHREYQIEDNRDSYREKPWIVYLRTLRIPIICPIHRKLFLMISDNFKNPESQSAKPKKSNFSSISSMKRMMNRNPNCNHNSSQFYNSCIVNIKFDKDGTTDDRTPDLLWKNSELYSECDEIIALGSEKILAINKSKLKTIAEIEENYEALDVILEGKLVNKYSLWTLKKLNPHHKSFLYALIKIHKIDTRKLAMNIVSEVVSMNNKWEKDCYYCVLSYMLVQTIQSDFDEGTEDLIKTIQKLLEFPIQPLKRAVMQALFTSENIDTFASPSMQRKQFNQNVSSTTTKKLNLKNVKRSQSTQKKILLREKPK